MGPVSGHTLFRKLVSILGFHSGRGRRLDDRLPAPTQAALDLCSRSRTDTCTMDLAVRWKS